MKDYFRNSFARDIFLQKYALTQSETWPAKARNIVDDVCGTLRNQRLLSKEDCDQLVHFITEMKFIPGGRYVYYAGREAAFYNNCLKGNTKILTDEGWVRADDEGVHNVLSPVDGQYYPAPFVKRGVQDLYEYTFMNVQGRSKEQWKVQATENHKWLLSTGKNTTDLRVGDIVPANSYSVDNDALGYVHGFMFGDGNEHGQLRICCEKDINKLPILTRVPHSLTYPKFANGDPVLYYKQAIQWKALPPQGASPEYIASFILGWIAADGNTTTASHKLCSVNKEALEWFRENAAMAGLVACGSLRSQFRDVVIGNYEYKDHELFIQTFKDGGSFAGFKVVYKEHMSTEEVYCPFEKVHNQLIIDNGMHTFNCYLFKGEEDTREEWARLAGNSTSALMSGGGIGCDYSVFRPEGWTLSRTGGQSSGPIPLMKMINEIGRNVMQGGSRRSAIYASLNWQHDDAEQFLRAKQWSDNLKQIKGEDFNFPAPLDMTNMSLNYDDDFITEMLAEKSLPDTFVENVRMAMSTGEPGFSFNFGDKENETLRNACTEVTSEDDSDVCNLGSINFARIDNVDELRDVVRVASKFLVCGTIRADLPYAKVYDVRDKNRRLGLGIMGLHEWLLKRGEKYEVTKDLHKWLEVYAQESKRSADKHCDRLYLSRPMGYRAIAPTGSIGILAGTTTGIEPLFSVAYKRRYLTDGTRWKYQFVVDEMAREMIQEYSVDPESIDCALDLAADPERRIKFQADVQDYVDMAISSTINLPAWGSKLNNEDKVDEIAKLLATYAYRLRGFTAYPDGARGGQPLTPIAYEDAIAKKGVIYDEHDICEITQHGGSCGI